MLLKDLGIFGPTNALHPSKLHHQRSVWGQWSVEAHKNENQRIICLGFDCKFDNTLIHKGSTHRKKKEEKKKHYVLVSFPTRCYVEHVVHASESSDDTARQILSVITPSSSEATLLALATDGKNVNTGKNNRSKNYSKTYRKHAGI